MSHNNELVQRCNHRATIELCHNVSHENLFDDSFWTTCINQSKDGFCYSLTMGKTNDDECDVIDEFFCVPSNKKKLLDQWFSVPDNVYKVVTEDKSVYYCKINSHSWTPKIRIFSDVALVEKLLKERDGCSIPLKRYQNNVLGKEFFIFMCMSLIITYYWHVFS